MHNKIIFLQLHSTLIIDWKKQDLRDFRFDTKSFKVISTNQKK